MECIVNHLPTQDAMVRYFGRLAACAGERNPPLRTDCDPDVPSLAHRGGPGADGTIAWEPTLIGTNELHALWSASLTAQIHPSASTLWSSFWSCVLGGSIAAYAVELTAMLGPTSVVEAFATLEGYRDNHGGNLEYAPVGFETTSSCLMVVRRSDGVVCIEDFERQSFKRVAPSLQALLDRLVP